MRASPWVLGLALTMASLVFGAADARAFCRSTTCKCKSKDTCAQDCGIDENGCKTKGAKLHWSGGCVGVSLNKKLSQNLDPDKVRAAAFKAFAAWSDVDCGGGQKASINLAALADATCNKIDYNPSGGNTNLVFFSDDNFVPSDTNDVLAKTVPHFDATTGEIFDADIDVDTSQNAFTLSTSTSSNDLQSVLTHEVGHLLGLDHTSDTTAVMYYQYSAGSLNRDLQPDDIAAICAAYPPSRKATCDPTPKGGFSDRCDSKSGGCAQAPSSPRESGLVALGVVAALAAAARLRTRGRTNERRSASVP